MYETLCFEIEDAVGWVRLDRPKQLNAISPQMVRELRSVVERVKGDDAVRVLVFTGTGRAFSAGADIAELAAMSTAADFLHFLEDIQSAYDAIAALEDVLVRHPEVTSVALVALPHPRLGEIGCAFVIAKNGTEPSLGSLCAFLEAAQVTRQFWPEELVLLEEFPMTPSGKVQKFRLREIAASRVK
ncbi:MAG: enoyl-CoA hydratase-related protein [Candidatus Binatia bacterium]